MPASTEPPRDQIASDKIKREKADMRKSLRAARKGEVAAHDPAVSALLFRCPPQPIAAMIPKGAVIGLYAATRDEAPTRHYAAWFAEAGHPIALPWLADEQSPMSFRSLANPLLADEDRGFLGLERGPFGVAQPASVAPGLTPDVVFVPLVGFTAEGERLGQGGGHYDRWLEQHPDTVAIGLGWDSQLVDALPSEPHDRKLNAIITPTRIYQPQK